MPLKQIKVGRWYETKIGVGQCEKVGGCFPVAVRIRIEKPFPRGVCNMVPRDVLREVEIYNAN